MAHMEPPLVGVEATLTALGDFGKHACYCLVGSLLWLPWPPFVQWEQHLRDGILARYPLHLVQLRHHTFNVDSY